MFMFVGISCADGDIRLIGGRQSEKFNEGRVEICSNGVWGTIYDDGSWDSRGAIVVCRQLGYNSNLAITKLLITPRACARGKVIGCIVVVVVVVVIGTKIAISRDVGI